MKDLINVHSKRCDKSTNRRLQAQQNPNSSTCLDGIMMRLAGLTKRGASSGGQSDRRRKSGNLWEIDENPCRQALYLVGG